MTQTMEDHPQAEAIETTPPTTYDFAGAGAKAVSLYTVEGVAQRAQKLNDLEAAPERDGMPIPGASLVGGFAPTEEHDRREKVEVEVNGVTYITNAQGENPRAIVREKRTLGARLARPILGKNAKRIYTVDRNGNKRSFLSS